VFALNFGNGTCEIAPDHLDGDVDARLHCTKIRFGTGCMSLRILIHSDHVIVYRSRVLIDDGRQVLARAVPRLLGVQSDRVFFLMHLYVPPDQRGQGIGSQMLHALADYLFRSGCRRIELDDMTDRFGASDNIYVKCGFVYRGGAAEMYASPARVLAHGPSRSRRPASSSWTWPESTRQHR
jgi:GNAT superfamily N-acetyltransferase